MTKMIRDVVEVGTHSSLEALMRALEAIRADLPVAASDVEVVMRGDDVFGRRLSLIFQRPQTAEELACEARYSQAGAHLGIAA